MPERLILRPANLSRLRILLPLELRLRFPPQIRMHDLISLFELDVGGGGRLGALDEFFEFALEVRGEGGRGGAGERVG